MSALEGNGGITAFIYPSGHGAWVKTGITRTSNPHDYKAGNVNVNILKMSGHGQRLTQVGTLFKATTQPDKSSLFTPEIMSHGIAQRLSTEEIILSLIPQMLKGRDFKGNTASHMMLQDILKEIMIIEKSAEIEYAKLSPPIIEHNPQYNKKFIFTPDPRHLWRRPEEVTKGTVERSNPPRRHGARLENTILTYPGLYIMAVDSASPHGDQFDFLRAFSLTNLRPDSHGLTDPAQFVRYNLITKRNYVDHWKPYIDSLDFTGIDLQTLDYIDDIRFAITIFKQLCYSFFSSDPLADNPADEDEDEINSFDDDDAGPAAGPAAGSTRGRDDHHDGERADYVRRKTLDITTIENLREHVKQSVHVFSIAVPQIKTTAEHAAAAASAVDVARVKFKRLADIADDLEEQINKMRAERTTRSIQKEIEELNVQLTAADQKWNEFTTGPFNDEKLKLEEAVEEAERIKNEAEDAVIDAVKQFISNVISTRDPALLRIIKNIIMRNILKNILKSAILYKKISLLQIIFFFRSLNCTTINIPDPSCFTPEINPEPELLKVPPPDVDTQELPEDMVALGVPTPVSRPEWYSDIDNFLRDLDDLIASPVDSGRARHGSAGGAGAGAGAGKTRRRGLTVSSKKRQKLKYSRKLRKKYRKRYTRRRR